jgi:nucleotide-binding universal stress UspA family protein
MTFSAKTGQPRRKVNLLVPVDGSPCSLRALAHAIRDVRGARVTVHLLNVQPVYDEYGMIPAYLSRRRYLALVRARAEAALAPGVARLKRAGVKHLAHTVFGETAPAIVRTARRLRCESIVMGTRGMGAIGGLLLGSVANRVIHLATTPVTFVK